MQVMSAARVSELENEVLSLRQKVASLEAELERKAKS
jgi:hypothetical protein